MPITSKEPPTSSKLTLQQPTLHGSKAIMERDQGNEECDRLTKLGADKPILDELILDVPMTFNLQGAKISALTQALAYQGIMERLPTHPHRTTTTENLQKTREAIHRYNGLLKTDESIWAGTWRHTSQTRFKQFLYKALHGTQKLRKYWKHISHKENHEFCLTCEPRMTESMEQILIHCQATPRRQIWALAEELWPHEQNLWPKISLGIILGCRTITLPPEENQENPDEGETERHSHNWAAKRLLQILISEAAHLVWVLRCERVIGDGEQEYQIVQTHTESKIHSRWLKIINAQLTKDKIIATKVKWDKISTPTQNTASERGQMEFYTPLSQPAAPTPPSHPQPQRISRDWSV